MTEELEKKVEKCREAMVPFKNKIASLSARERLARDHCVRKREELKRNFDEAMAETTVTLDATLKEIAEEMNSITASNEYNFARIELREAEEELAEIRVKRKRVNT